MVRELDLGGSERQLSVIARSLPPSDFEVHVGCLRGNGARARELQAAGVRMVKFSVTSFRGTSVVTGAYRMLRYLVDNEIELVHTFDWPMNVFGVPVACAAPGVAVVSSQRAHRELSPGLPRHLLRLTDQVTNGIVVNSQFIRRHLIEDEAVASQRIHVCYNGIDLKAFSREGRRKPPELADASLVVGVVCALRPEKGLETLLDAFARVSSLISGMRLVIAGSGPWLGELLRRAADLGLGDSCIFLPARDDVAGLLRGIDIFVLPSLSEAFSNSLMEAMACGCCAVASDVGGNPEVVFDGKTGILFPPRDVEALAGALRLLIENESLRLKVAEAGAQLIHTRFSLESSVRRMAEIYRLLLGDK